MARFGRSSLWGLLGLLVVALVGCGQSTSSTSSAPSGHRTVTDMTGRSVTLPAQVNRVATDYPAVSQIVFMLGAGNKLVADNQGTATGLFPTIYPRVKDVATPFSADTAQINTEALLNTRPDVIFVSSGSKSLLAQLTKTGIPVVAIAQFTGPDALKAGVSLIGGILGGDAPARAQRYASYYDAAVAQATAATSHLTDAQRPEVYYDAGSPLVTEGTGSIVTSWITEAGGRNVAADNGVSGVLVSVTLEDVIRWNPEYIVCRDAATKQEILSDSRWQNVAAVRDNHVLINPEGVFVWSVRSAEAALQPLWAGQVLHPDLFSGVDIRQVVRQFYQEFYSYNLSDQQIDEILDPPAS